MGFSLRDNGRKRVRDINGKNYLIEDSPSGFYTTYILYTNNGKELGIIEPDYNGEYRYFIEDDDKEEVRFSLDNDQSYDTVYKFSYQEFYK